MTERLSRFVQSKGFQFSVLGIILVASGLVGMETSPTIMSHYGPLIETLNSIILWIFVAEAALKMLQHGTRIWRYFYDPWNVFDFAIVAICFMPLNARYAAVLRMVRILRALRLVTALPKLQLLVNALIKSVPSMIYVGLMLLLTFYVYAVMGVFLFRENDPVHFGDLATSMLSLFRVVTLEDWTDIMYIQMYGSAGYFYDYQTSVVPQSHARPLVGAAFFISFVMLGTMIMLNLFIGVILNSMTEAEEDRDRQIVRQQEESGQQATPSGTVFAIERQLDSVKQQLHMLRLQLEDEAEQE